MAQPTAFVCFDPERHQADYERFISEVAQSPVAFTVDDGSLSAHFPADSWSKLVRGKIGRCDLMIILIGDEVASEFVDKEIQVAKSANVPFFGVFTPGIAASANLPSALASNRMIPWDWAKIGSAVQQLGGEGKNHKFK